MLNTEVLKLKKPEDNEYIFVEDLNANMDTIEAELATVLNITNAPTADNLASKAELKVIVGWLANRLKAVMGKDLSNAPSKSLEDLNTHIGSNGLSHAVATQSLAGFESVTDKVKLDGIQAGANNYTHPPTHPVSMITGLAAVATSAKYNDLSGVPTLLSQFSNDLSYARIYTTYFMNDTSITGTRFINLGVTPKFLISSPINTAGSIFICTQEGGNGGGVSNAGMQIVQGGLSISKLAFDIKYILIYGI